MVKKGHTNNPNGRPKGVPSKITKEVRESIKQFVEDNIAGLQDDCDMLDPKERLHFLEKLLSYILPKPQTIDLTDDRKNTIIAPIIMLHLDVKEPESENS